jgi:hypothetical protein
MPQMLHLVYRLVSPLRLMCWGTSTVAPLAADSRGTVVDRHLLVHAPLQIRTHDVTLVYAGAGRQLLQAAPTAAPKTSATPTEHPFAGPPTGMCMCHICIKATAYAHVLMADPVGKSGLISVCLYDT